MRRTFAVDLALMLGRCVLAVLLVCETDCQAWSSDAAPGHHRPLFSQKSRKNNSPPLKLLFCGNSHTGNHNIPGMVAALCSAIEVRTGPTQTLMLPGAFLDNVKASPRFRSLLRNARPDCVILQGQKISMSGKYIYSREAAESLTKQAEKAGSRVLLFAEWGRLNVEGETERIEVIYRQIQEDAGGELIPIGKAWQLAHARRPELVLHAADGNHSSLTGAFLASCVLASAISKENPVAAARSVELPIKEMDRVFLATVAWEAWTNASNPTDATTSAEKPGTESGDPQAVKRPGGD